MLSLFFLGSGSKGNSAVLEIGRHWYLIDAGLSSRHIERELTRLGIRLDRLAGVFLTHEHNDHIKGLRGILKKKPMPVYASQGTLNAISSRFPDLIDLVPLMHGRELDLGHARMWPFTVPHDAAEPIGFRIESCGRVIGLASDLGHVNQVILEHLLDCDLLCLESNYDEEMLTACQYPFWLKERIRGPNGHLANKGVRGILARLKRDLQHLVLMHVSQESNTPELVLSNVAALLQTPYLRNTTVTVATQDEVTPLINLGATVLSARQMTWRQQTFPEIYASGNSHDW